MKTGNNMIDGDNGSHPSSPYYEENKSGNTLLSMNEKAFEKLLKGLQTIKDREDGK
jgi:hypothetical protein